ncbi:bacterial low temperature requirement A protein-domain-containing protein [Halteromyces radiatus]|uniref:bacterial low temperature requirement A protein-domain-containing protein n=1 Tax=Halteromyces radiatus TaxID=101107 RepID=UPI00221EF0D6|nr:bacterial low temperature requirement A protein-domain-containing protein [Halteromyces radiatus]KAI8097210.1 bacterial low temperature requirement A protein-domain-containing protein [Halteromyces radiatus]
MSSRKGTIRRGPTMRGGYRPPIGNQHLPRQPTIASRRQRNTDEEEFIALNQNSGAHYSDYDDDDDDEVEMEHIDIRKHDNTSREKDPLAYQHGQETFGDVFSHPIEEFQAHRKRKEEYEERQRKARSGIIEPSVDQTPSEEFVVVVHFRQLRGNQGFALDHEKADHFAKKIGLTQKQRIQFNGVRDTDGLTAFLYKTKVDFSIKIHHKAEVARNSHLEHDSQHPTHDHHHLEHNPHNETIEFNDNVYVEFKPKHHHHEELPQEATRRPFFRYPEPDLSADIGEEKAASWLELFYDLFYVATLTQFTHTHVIKDWASLGTYASWFVITWWAWISSSLYTARFDTDDVVHHIWKLIEMCAVIGMAGNSDHFLNSPGYVYGYMALKAVLVIEYTIVFIVAVMIRSKSKIPLSFYIGANIVSMALWGGSLLMLDQEIHRLLWYLGLLAEILVNIIVRGDKTLSWAASHLAERLGLLTLIVLGENLMSLVPFVATSSTAILMMVPNFMAVTIIFGFFFMYFEDFNKEVFLHNNYHQVWVYLHFPLHLLQVAFGISLIDTLRLYKQQMEAEGKLPTLTTTASSASGDHGASASASGEHGAAASASGEHGAAASASGEHGAAASASASNEHGTATSASSPTASSDSHTSAPAAAHKLARRAVDHIRELSNHDSLSDYNPMAIELQRQQQYQQKQQRPTRPSIYAGYLTWGNYAAHTMVFTAMQFVTSYTSQADNGLLDQPINHHHLARRSGAAEGEDAILSDEEKVFVYKTFLIFGGGIIIINSFIKLLNTKLSDIYGKVIIGTRVIVAAILWSLCAVPFAQLEAIIMLAVMLGSVIFLALVDLLD